MKTLLAATTIVALMSGAAHAAPRHEWWGINFSLGQCRSANDIPPAVMIKIMTDADNMSPTVKIKRAVNGEVIGVYIHGSHAYSMYTTTRPMCQSLLKELIKSGEIVPQDDLR
jgi:hypothetical protein